MLASQNPGHLLSKRFLTTCLLQFPPSYLWLYFFCFFFFTMIAILRTTIRCCFATHAFTNNLQSEISFNSFCTSQMLLLHFPNPPSALHIIYLGTFSATFICHPVFIFLLKISVEIAKSILFGKSTTIDPSLFLVPTAYLPTISSSPMFPSPTYPFRSAPRTILSCFNTLFISPSRSSQKSFFSSMLLLTCGAWRLLYLGLTLLPPVS